MPSPEHTSKKFDAELEAVRARVLQMGGIVEDQIVRGLDALARGDTALAARVVEDDHRVNALEVAIDEDPLVGFVPQSEAPSPERDTAVRTDVARAMRKLDAAQRELLWLAYAHGASHEEIASVLGVRAISVRTLLFRARKKLAVLLERKEP